MTLRVRTIFILGLALLGIGGSGGSMLVRQAEAQGGPTQSAQPTSLGAFSAWTAYSAPVKNGKVCYALAQPKDRKPGGLARDPAYFFISNRPKDSVRNEISIIVGFPVRPNSQVQLAVGEASFNLYTRADGAFMQSADEEIALVKAMRGGTAMVVKSTSVRGNVTTDSYSLAGISAALEAIDKNCR